MGAVNDCSCCFGDGKQTVLELAAGRAATCVWETELEPLASGEEAISGFLNLELQDWILSHGFGPD